MSWRYIVLPLLGSMVVTLFFSLIYVLKFKVSCSSLWKSWFLLQLNLSVHRYLIS
uniref:Uncharacterized protein n=1 Tax=Rhizophora mucronata TaxID=61149 RepID=A0A2P2MHV0_RHIMU